MRIDWDLLTLIAGFSVAIWALHEVARIVAAKLEPTRTISTPSAAERAAELEEITHEAERLHRRIARSLGHLEPIQPGHVIVRSSNPPCVYVVERVHDDYVQDTMGCVYSRSRLGPHFRPRAHTLEDL